MDTYAQLRGLEATYGAGPTAAWCATTETSYNNWLNHRHPPTPQQAAVIHAVWHATERITEEQTRAIAAAWMNAANPLLGGRTPRAAVRDHPDAVIAAAEAFITKVETV